ncbi:MAG: PA0069 family radical SAM protein [Neomegalonema sp.]|nr:PA0069 family radical SAM protein [Neomegalonema sp.]
MVNMARAKGRGAESNASGRYEREKREAFDDGWAREDAPAPLRTEVEIDASRSIITRNNSPDISFDRSINPYRGCEHGCVYCFARPTHAYLGWSAGLDFETKLVAKPNAAALLRRALARRGYKPAVIAMGANTDPYQPIEKEWRIVRGVLELLLEARHPVAIVTKGALIMRDVDILGEMGRQGLAHVAVSVTTLDRKLARSMEPRAATPARRLQAIETLAAAGVPTAVMMAPIAPGLNCHEIENVLAAARDAGAVRAEYVTLRLPLEVSPLFQEWLATHQPHRAAKVMRQVREMHGGRDYDPEWGARQRGRGPVSDLIARRFAVAVKKLGFRRRSEAALRLDLFRPPRSDAASTRQQQGSTQLTFDFD